MKETFVFILFYVVLSELIHPPTLPILSTAISVLSQVLERSMGNGKDAVKYLFSEALSKGTFYQYAAELDHFKTWCASQNYEWVPASKTATALHLTHKAHKTRKRSAFNAAQAAISAAAISFMHETADLSNLTRSGFIKYLNRAHRRLSAQRVSKKYAISVADTRKLIQSSKFPNCQISKI